MLLVVLFESRIVNLQPIHIFAKIWAYHKTSFVSYFNNRSRPTLRPSLWSQLVFFE